MLADVQAAVAENLHARRVASGITLQMNRTAPGSAHTAVGDQRGAAQARGNEETREAAGCAADRAAVVDKCGTAPARLGQHRGAAACVTHRTAVVGDVGMVRGRQVEVCYAAGRAAGRCTLIGDISTARARPLGREVRYAAVCAGGSAAFVGNRGIARRRGIFEICYARCCPGDAAGVVDNRGIARGRGIEEVGNTFHVKSAAVHHIGAVIDNRGTASGRGVEEDRSAALSAGGYGSGVGDDCATSRGRAV